MTPLIQAVIHVRYYASTPGIEPALVAMPLLLLAAPLRHGDAVSVNNAEGKRVVLLVDVVNNDYAAKAGFLTQRIIANPMKKTSEGELLNEPEPV